jgi:hypothetical protein
MKTIMVREAEFPISLDIKASSGFVLEFIPSDTQIQLQRCSSGLVNQAQGNRREQLFPNHSNLTTSLTKLLAALKATSVEDVLARKAQDAS